MKILSPLNFLFFLLLNLVFFGHASPLRGITVEAVNFQNWNTGGNPTLTYTQSMCGSDFNIGTLNTVRGLGLRTWVERYSDSGSQVLKVKYPANVYGFEASGATWNMRFAGRDEYYLVYRVKFSPGFEWQKGGKLPGLCGGAGGINGAPPAGGFYGGYDGFSSRYMWTPGGKLILYFYWSGQPSRTAPRGEQYGEGIDLNTTMATGSSYWLKMRVKLNTAGQANGIMQVWASPDGTNYYEKLYRGSIEYRRGAWKIDQLMFHTFYGGGDSSFAPPHDNYACFDDVNVGY